MMTRAISILVIFLYAGCAAQPAHVESPPPYLLHLPGIGGERRMDHHLTQGLVDGGFTGKIEIYNWTEHDPGLPALLSYKNNRREAQRIADKLTAIRRANPSRPIYLTAHSGGTGLAIWALEKLPPDVQVDRVILLASALSPGYDLSLALSHVREAMYNFWSPLDTIVLGTGTTMFGTIDGVKGPAAGFKGFQPRPGASVKQYQKLRQMEYKKSWAQWGNTGGHAGPMAETFSSKVLAPLVTEPVLTNGRVQRSFVHSYSIADRLRLTHRGHARTDCGSFVRST
jgi:pimeloyl-ACP methyl ester carboxylesterase